jgi:hypothetical protein
MAADRPRDCSLHELQREFKVPLAALKRVADAQEDLRVQFAEHQCPKNQPDKSAC